MEINKKNLKEILVTPKYINEKSFDLAVKEAERENRKIEDVLIDKELIKDEQLGQLIASFLNFKFINLRKEKIDKEMLNLIPEIVANSKEIIVFGKKDDFVLVGMVNPGDLETKHLIEKRVGQKILPCYITKRDLLESLNKYKLGIKEEFNNILKKLKNSFLSKEERDDLTVKMVDTLLQYGCENKASDIHVEPHYKNVVIRFRIDGIMHEVLSIDKNLHELILMRIKILAKMRTDEHMSAQDGKIRFLIGEKNTGNVVDVRVSIVPITEGENIVMRLLFSKNRQFNLNDLGFSEENLKIINKIIKHPHGIILVTGPTGSGKTTTLYAVMKILNKPEVHISTIEDPVEYDVFGISQIQVNNKTNLTFTKGLRAIVRQDPDIIMIGEIRDEETAEVAINSAMTGHLVLSTLHTNDAATTLPRLLDMNIEPFLISSTVNIAIAQRLVRKLCEKCRESLYVKTSSLKGSLPEKMIKKISKGKNEIHTYHSKGCENCNNTGYSGRIGIFEVLTMDDDIKKLIFKRASSDQIEEKAKENGMKTMLEDGIDKVFKGITTIEEILKVTNE